MPTACSNSHTTRTPGAGLCCSKVGAPGFRNPGDHISVTAHDGKCGTCWIVPAGERIGKGGVPTPDSRFKHIHLQFTHGLGSCPSHRTGCCAIAQLASPVSTGPHASMYL